MVKKKTLFFGAALLLLAIVSVVTTRQSTPASKLEDTKSRATDRLAQHRHRVTAAVRALRTARGDSGPLASPSAHVRRHFPKGNILQSRVEQLPDGEFRRTEIVETSLKYPYVRVQTDFRLDGTNEVLLRRNEVAADHVVVSVKPGVTEEQLTARVSAIDALVVRRLEVDGLATYIVGLPAPDLDAVPDAVKTLSAFSDVVAEVDGDSVSRKTAVPNDTYLGSLWHINNPGGSSGLADADIDATEAWSLHTGSSDVVIAISDTGMEYYHPDLRANVWTNVMERVNAFDDDSNSYRDDIRGWNFYDGNNDVSDTDGHGTFVSGVIGAVGNNSIGVAGISWRCKLLPVRVLDTDGGFSSDIAEGFDYARNRGVKIINASHGGGSSIVMKAAVDRLQSAGVLLIAAAGNDGDNLETVPLYPASYTHANIIAVAATDRVEELASFSSYGAVSVDLAAPGVQIMSTERGSSYATYNGTSFAVPQVSGVAALVKAKYPTLTATQIRARILSNVDKLPTLTGKCATGGRLNAYRALLPATSLTAALDRDGQVWSTSGSARWVAANTPFAHDRLDAVETGKIWNSQESVLQTTVTGPGIGTFWWKVSSEQNYDYLVFYIDGAQHTYLTGRRDWVLQSFQVDSGTHTLTWKYIKDNSAAGGDDKGMIDQFTFKGLPPSILSQPTGQSAPIGGTAIFTVGAGGPGPYRYQWKKNGANIAGATTSKLTFNPVKATHAGNYTVSVQNNGGTVSSAIAKLTICTVSNAVKEMVLPHEASTAAFAVTIKGSCSWDVQTTNDWIQLISPTSISSSTSYQFSVAANTSAYPRLGAITVGANRVWVKQLAAPASTSLGDRRFTMTITNSATPSPIYGSFLLATVQRLDGSAFLLTSSAQAISSDAGTFNYQPINSAEGQLSLSGTNSAEVALAFKSHSAGTFTFQQGGGPEIYGTFRAASDSGDFNEDGYIDLLWQTTTKQLTAWCMRGTDFVAARKFNAAQPLPAGWKALATGDLSGQGQLQAVVQWTNGSLGTVMLSTNADSFAVTPLSGAAAVTPGTKLISVGDFNLDGKQDLLLQGTNSTARVHLMDGTNLLETVALRKNTSAGAGWRLVGASDFNNDASLDLLWQHSDGRLQVWFFVGTTYISAKDLKRPTTGWKAIGLGDFNNDGRADILFQSTDRRVAIWEMNGAAFVRSQTIRSGQPAPLGWKLIGPKGN